jgi:hypothetical protein
LNGGNVPLRSQFANYDRATPAASHCVKFSLAAPFRGKLTPGIMRMLSFLVVTVALSFASQAALLPDYKGKPFRDSVYHAGAQVIPAGSSALTLIWSAKAWPATTRTPKTTAAAG